jgi:hypothetical protein
LVATAVSNPFQVNPRLHKKLFDTSKELDQLMNNPKELKKRQYGALLNRTCISFRTSLDAGLREAIYSLRHGVNDSETRKVAQNVFDDAASFAEYLKFQERALVSCGASKAMARSTIQQIEQMRTSMREAREVETYYFNAEILIETIEKSTNRVCEAADQVSAGLAEQQARHLAMKRGLIATGSVLLITTAVVATGGTAVSLAGAAGVTAAGMAKVGGFLSASGVMGGWFIGKGGRLRDPLTKEVEGDS